MARAPKVLGGVIVVLGMLYPFLVYLGLKHFSLTLVTYAVAAVLTLRLGVMVFEGTSVSKTFVALHVVAIAGVVILGFAGSEMWLLGMPALINLGMLVIFGASLTDTPMIERFARRFEPELSVEKQEHCRQFTWAWCIFFVVNGTVCFVLIFGPRTWWALYTGLVSYVLMGGMFVSEFVVRRLRFRNGMEVSA